MSELRVVFENYQRLKPMYEREMAEKKRRRNLIIIVIIIVSMCVLCAYGLYMRDKRNQIVNELCRTGTPEEVKAAIEKNILNINMHIHERYSNITITPYMLAARENHNPEVLRVLEQAGAKPDKNEALERAAGNGNIETAKFLVQNGATNVDYALERFADHGDGETVKFLVQNGATDVDYALRQFASRGDIETVKFLLQNGATDKNGALESAVRNGEIETIKFLVQNGATNVNYALWQFANRGDGETVKFLVQNGATNVDYALEKFASHGDVEVVKFLLQNGATDKNKALEIAAHDGKIEMVKFLLQNGATDKNAALERAVCGGQLEMAKFLIQSGANVDWHALWLVGRLIIPSRRVIANLKPQFEQIIIIVAREYGFEIVAKRNKYKEETKDGKPSFSEKIIAQEESANGCVYFCTDSVCIAEGYLIFSPSTFRHKKYNELGSISIRSWLSDELSGELLDRTEKALNELTY